MIRFIRTRGFLALVFIVVLGPAAFAKHRNAPAVATPAHFVHPNSSALAKKGFDDFYNQDFDRSIRAFEILVKEHPDDPFATNYLLSAVLFKELTRIGAMDTETYANDSFMNRKAVLPLDPAARARIIDLETRAELQANALLANNPNDVEVLYARGVTRALRCTYMGMGEKAWLSALKAAIGARRDHERVLELDPDYIDAEMLVGIHNYIVGSLSWPVRVSASVVGIGGNKQKGLNMLRRVAASDSLASMDAKSALALFLRREQHYVEALGLVRGMTAAYPRSFVMALEYANLLNAAGRGPEAITAYRQILANYKDRKYPVPEPAKAAFGLGVSLRGQCRFAEAAEAFDLVTTLPGGDRELGQRATLAAGEMYDTIQKRELAIRRYENVISGSKAGGYVEIAQQHLRQPYQYR